MKYQPLADSGFSLGWEVWCHCLVSCAWRSWHGGSGSFFYVVLRSQPGAGGPVKLTLSPPSLLYLSKRQGSPPRRQARVCGDQCLTKTVSLTGITLGVALIWLWFLLAAGFLLKCIITNRNAGGANLGLGEGLKVILKLGC